MKVGEKEKEEERKERLRSEEADGTTNEEGKGNIKKIMKKRGKKRIIIMKERVQREGKTDKKEEKRRQRVKIDFNLSQ